MGANGSVPRTASFENPRPAPPQPMGIQITPYVLERLEAVRKNELMTAEKQQLAVNEATPEQDIPPPMTPPMMLPTPQITPPVLPPPVIKPLPPTPTNTPAQLASTQTATPAAADVCKNCEAHKQVEIKNVKPEKQQNTLKVDEIHQVQFEQALQKIEREYIKPGLMQEDLANDIKAKQKQLVECYKSEIKRETFECEKLAKDFQSFIYEQQRKAMNIEENM